MCRSVAGVCDVPERCTGTSASCPLDVFLPSTTVCRSTTGVCDVAESCTGTSAACPPDGFQPSSTVCRASAGVCDAAETCTGSSATCPADAFQPSSTVCRASAGVCDVAESCTGSNATCPADGFQPMSTVCRASAGVCDMAETCTGSSVNCPPDQQASVVCGDGKVCGNEVCDPPRRQNGCAAGTECNSNCSACITTTLPPTLAVSDAVTIGGSPFCFDLLLTNPTAVGAVQGVLTVERDPATLQGATCADRTAGFSCTANLLPAGTIPFVVIDVGGRCIDPGSGPIARICLQDNTPACLAGQNTMLDLSQVEVADCNSQPLGAATQSGTLFCAQGPGDCKVDGVGIDIFDVLATIDIALGRSTPTLPQRVLCDDNCDGRIDIFDILREIDVILGRLAHPLACPAGAAPQRTQLAGVLQATSSNTSAPRILLRRRGREVVLENRGVAVRGVELTLVPEGGAVTIRAARGSRRLHGFTVVFHQPAPGAPIRVLAVSLDGQAIPPGAGRIIGLRTTGGTHGRLRLATALVAQ